MVKRGCHFISPDHGPNQALVKPAPKSQTHSFKGVFLASGAEMVVKLPAHTKQPVFNSAQFLVLRRMQKRIRICEDGGDRKSQDKESQRQHGDFLFHFVSPPSFNFTHFITYNKIYTIFAIFVVCLLSGCSSSISGFGLGKSRPILPEYRQKVGLYVHDQPERFYYPGTTTLDISDLMAFHLQQVLPYTAESAFKGIFQNVELQPAGPNNKIEFKSPDLAGYFEIKVTSARYDYPDPNVSTYRADIELLVEFKTLQHELVWSGAYRGDGVGFSNPDRNLTRFGKEAGSALEDAFQNAVYQMQDGVLNSPRLRQYFRSRSAFPTN